MIAVRSDPSTSASAHLERLVLASMLLVGRMPDVRLRNVDFENEEHRRTFEACVAVARCHRTISATSIWQQDRQLDPLELCMLVRDFACDHLVRAKDLDSYAFALLIARRREACA